MTGCTAVPLADRPDLLDGMRRIEREVWSEHMRHDAIAGRHWHRLYTSFAAFQVLLLDPDGAIAGMGYTIPLPWDETIEGLPDGWDAALEAGCRQAEAGMQPNTLCALAAIVAPEYLGQGLSPAVIGAMKERAAAHGLKHLIAPVRPTWKSRYRYIVPDALIPVEIDREEDRGTYIEPNVWMVHRI